MIILLVERLISAQTFGTIFSGRVVSSGLAPEGSTIRVRAKFAAMLGKPAAGEHWKVAGALSQTRWGAQVEATSATRTLPSGRMLRDYIAGHVPGVGPDRAERLWRAFGAALPSTLLDGDIGALATVMAPDRPILGPRLAALLVREWKSAHAEAALVSWLQEQGVDDLRLVRRIARILGQEARDRLDRNPWSLVTLLDWKKVDGLGLRLAREKGVNAPEDMPERLLGAVDAAVKELIATGATAIADAALRTSLAALLKVKEDHVRVRDAIDLGVRNGGLVEGEGTDWRAPGCATMEENLTRRLKEIIARPVTIDHARVDRALADYEAAAGKLHPEQMAAVLAVMDRQFACLQGGAGVGKTHTTKAICAAWEAAGGKVLLAALSGKAALRLSRSTGRLARTLFRTLKEVEERGSIAQRLGSGDVEAGEQQKLAGRLDTLAEITAQTLVLIDEASMVDLATMHALLRQMPDGARLLLVGDDRQLPPISFGLVFHRLVVDPAVTSKLTVVHRQTDSSGIPAVAASLRNRQVPQLGSYDGVTDGVTLLRASSPEEIAEGVLRIYEDFADEDLLIVAPTNEGPSGVRTLNRQLHDRHLRTRGGLEVRNSLGEFFSVGEPVLHRRNDYRRGLFNGSLGNVRMVSPSTRSLTARFDGEEMTFGPDELVDLSLGYAMTCHRSQGSQATRVVVALTPSRLLGPSWLYTALTRAERQVVLVGSPEVMETALSGPWEADQRHVGWTWAS